MAEAPRRRVLFYVQHLLGIGHLARASRIAQGLVAGGFETLLVTGGPPVGAFPPAGLPTLALPPVRTADTGFSGLVDEAGQPVTSAFMAHRRDRLVGALRQFRPDAVIIEAFPFGRRQMRAELLALLEAARQTRPRPLVACSIRDVLQPAGKPGRARETLATLQAYFDLVLVHGDPAFMALEESFGATGLIASDIAYTGLVTGPAPEAGAERFDAVVSAGGGAAMGRLARVALEARQGSTLDAGRWCVVTGPNAPADTVADLRSLLRTDDVLAAYRNDLPSLLAKTRLSISQAGYNTCGDLLHGNAAMVLVPFAQGSEQEQTLRAARLKDLRRAVVVTETALSPETMRAAIEEALRLPAATLTLKLDGAAETARVVARRLSGGPPA